jgi:hypothetical protein
VERGVGGIGSREAQLKPPTRGCGEHARDRRPRQQGLRREDRRPIVRTRERLQAGRRQVLEQDRWCRERVVFELERRYAGALAREPQQVEERGARSRDPRGV